MVDPPAGLKNSRLSVCIFVQDDTLARSLSQCLSPDRYSISILNNNPEFFDFIQNQKQQLDCLVLQEERSLLPVYNWLYEEGTMLPVVILTTGKDDNHNLSSSTDSSKLDVITYFYHPAEIHLPEDRFNEIERCIEQAITKFLSLTPNYSVNKDAETIKLGKNANADTFAFQQRERLAEKLKERLGYLGVYYKRNPRYFYRHLSKAEKQKLLQKLSADYRQIILSYFSSDETLNQQIDNFVNMIFFADLPVAQIVEIHMELMDKFSKQLKLEGRNEDILLDYRLTLIDIIAHLCEMYRRSIPRES